MLKTCKTLSNLAISSSSQLLNTTVQTFSIQSVNMDGLLASHLRLPIAIIFCIFAFIVKRQIRHVRKRSERERERGAGSGKVIKSGFEHGTQWCCMSARCPQGYIDTNKTTYFPSLVSKTLPSPTKHTNNGVQNTWHIKNTNLIY